MEITGPNFAKDLISQILEMFDKALRDVYHKFWDIFMSIISEHWGLILIVLFALLILAIIIAIGGRWGFLGSLLYNYLYFGILFILGLIKGPEVFLSEYFEFFCLLLLYPACYYAVGVILDKLEVRN